MASKRKNNPNQPELPIDGPSVSGGKPKPEQKADAKAPEGSNAETPKPKKAASGNGNGHAHILAENVAPAARFAHSNQAKSSCPYTGAWIAIFWTMPHTLSATARFQNWPMD